MADSLYKKILLDTVQPIDQSRLEKIVGHTNTTYSIATPKEALSLAREVLCYREFMNKILAMK
jgi:hypothetical protein